MNLWAALGTAWAAMAAIMLALWLVQRRTGNAAIVDVAWSFGTGLTAAALALAADGAPERKWLVAALGGAWGLRLGVHLWARVAGDAEEDIRYREFRRRHGGNVQAFLFGFFQLQALWAVLFAVPMVVAARNPAAGLGITDFAGVAVWVIAVVGESVADRQLASFRRDPANRGKVCRRGLWAWSRHPNYFFEWIHWWAYPCIGLGAPHGWITLLGPVVMFAFLRKITGIPLLEERLVQSRGDAYREYQRSTSEFFPLPPKRVAP